MRLPVLFLALVLYTAVYAQQTITHQTNAANLNSNYTLLDVDGLNNNPNAVIVVTADAGSIKKNPHPIGVWYTGSKWSIFNQDRVVMQEGLTYTVQFYKQPGNTQFVHRTNLKNAQKGLSYIDNPLLNNNPKASAQLTQLWNPVGQGGIYNESYVSLNYDGAAGKWYIINDNKTNIPDGASFNIVISGNPQNLAKQTDSPDPAKPKTEIIIGFDANAAIANLMVYADTLVGNWNFENGLDRWSPTGTAFNRQPTYGNNVSASRVRYDYTLEGGGLGGDYWRNTPYPVGHKGDYWIGTFENQPEPYKEKENGVYIDKKRGDTQGDEPIGTLISASFKLYHQNILFLLGGGNDRQRLRVELQVLKADYPAGPSNAADGEFYVLESRSNSRNTEEMRRQWFSLGPQWMGKTFRIKIIDNSNSSWGHINVDDFVFTNEFPRNVLMEIRNGNTSEWVDRDFPVWGVADTHEHPYLNNAHGGGVVQGSLTGATNTETLPNNGWPDFQYRPAFDRGDYTKTYDAWIKRAYKGGVRLMSALAVNNWMFSSAMMKRLFKGGVGTDVGSFTISGGDWDDKSISTAQIVAIKRWAALPQNQSWVGIATTPAEARKLILENKLALVLGIEVDILGDFVEKAMGDPRAIVLPTDMNQRRQMIGNELDRLKGMGVVQVTPIHYVSEPWGGAAIFNRWFNEQNRLFTGKNVVVENGNRWGIRYRVNNDQWGTADASAREMITGHSRTIAFDPSWDNVPLGHVNSLGLTTTGQVLLEEMAKRGMIIDVEHASYKTAEGFFSVAKNRLNGYPIISSHTDMGQLSFTGSGEWQRDNYNNFDRENAAMYGSTLLSNLRHEGQATDEKLLNIKNAGGTLGIIMLPYRKNSYLNERYAYNNNDGSTKTWAQMYLYGINFMNGTNVGFSMDQGFVKSLGPRFGLNSAYNLSMENTDALKKTKRLEQTKAQGFGVAYSEPVRYTAPQWQRRGTEWHNDWPRFRKPDEAQNFAFDGTNKEDMYVDGWIAINAYKAGRNPWVEGEDKLPNSGYPTHAGRIKNYVRGFNIPRNQFSKIHEECGILGANCHGATKHERVAAYCVANGINPRDLPEFNNDAWVNENYAVLLELWDHWEKMEGSKAGNVGFPLRRSVLGDKEWDYNMDGLAHYGLLPDFFQDLYNIFKEKLGANSLKPAALIGPLFRSAEDYLRMWEKAERLKSTIK